MTRTGGEDSGTAPLFEAERWSERDCVPVSQLVAWMRERLREHFDDVWTEGEIGSLHGSRLGHWYFDLKDESARLRCVLFRSQADRLPFEPEEGMHVRVRARADVYPERGALQLIVAHLEPRGAGALRVAFEQMRRRLEAEGLFDPSHKRPLPRLPRRIGLVTSIHSAAIRDFLRGLERRRVKSDVLVYDAAVQGEGAWREVVRGLHLLDATPSVDVVVLARGGGSLEDLWTFNREELVRAVFEADTPVVSAIGHEVDVVLTDLVADVRAATPTAAAEIVVPDGRALAARVEDLERRLVGRQRARLADLSHRLDALRRGLVHPARRLGELAQRLADLRERLVRAIASTRERASGRLAAASGRLDALSPLAVLARGYSITWSEAAGAILTSSAEVEPGEGIRVRLARGSLRATVRDTNGNEEGTGS